MGIRSTSPVNPAYSGFLWRLGLRRIGTAEIGILIAATERVCDLAEQESPAVTVVRTQQPEGLKRQKISSEWTDETVARATADNYGSILPDPLLGPG